MLHKVPIIGISESKLDDSMLSSESEIANFDLIRYDRNRHGGGVAGFTRNGFSDNTKSFLPSEIEKIFTETFFTTIKDSYCGYYLSSIKPRKFY